MNDPEDLTNAACRDREWAVALVPQSGGVCVESLVSD
jgi:hypothetical protein